MMRFIFLSIFGFSRRSVKKLCLFVENCEIRQKIVKILLLCLKLIWFLASIYPHCLCFPLNKEGYKLISPSVIFPTPPSLVYLLQPVCLGVMSLDIRFITLGNGALQQVIFNVLESPAAGQSHFSGVV